jgi:hypothetical protein
MTEDEARRIAEEELRRINAVLDLDVKIESCVSVPGLWIFNTTGRGSGPDRPQHLKGITVDADGRVNTSLTVAHSDEQSAKFRASLANTDDLRSLIPRSKFDGERAEAAIALGYPAVEPILPDLLRWLQDMNWPIARKLAEFIAGIGAPVAPHLRMIFAGNDNTWKYWLIGDVIGCNAELFDLFKDELIRIANNPTPDERQEELDERAREVLENPPVTSS